MGWLTVIDQRAKRLVLRGSVGAVNSSDNGVTRSGDSFDLRLLSHDEADISEKPAAEQLGDGDDDNIVLQRNGENREFEGRPLGDQLQGSRFNIDGIEIYHVRSVIVLLMGEATTTSPRNSGQKKGASQVFFANTVKSRFLEIVSFDFPKKFDIFKFGNSIGTRNPCDTFSLVLRLFYQFQSYGIKCIFQ